ncbi:MAG: hypothetical protein E6651_17315, partial [Acinetobacter sp.]|uniref:AAA family ATPase n=1 Tax=Acinetobacter sp. TaxID=472 RepID=UPI00291095B8|nr:hypothetical protein [Acinetobacter sp.]
YISELKKIYTEQGINAAKEAKVKLTNVTAEDIFNSMNDYILDGMPCDRVNEIITSNNEKELPDAFLRRCFFHYIEFPDEATMREIIAVHFPNISATLVNEALQVFFKLREIPNLKKPPSTSELIDWLSLLMADDMPEDVLRNRDTSKAIPPLYGALIKNEQDVQLLERLAFMSRR